MIRYKDITVQNKEIKTNKDKFSLIKTITKTMDLHYLSSVEIERHFETSMVKLNI
jgi:hypothetical protein